MRHLNFKTFQNIYVLVGSWVVSNQIGVKKVTCDTFSAKGLLSGSHVEVLLETPTLLSGVSAEPLQTYG